jgi:hypothetical protein
MPVRVESTNAERMIQHLYTTLFDREPEEEVLEGLIAYFGDGKLSARIQLMTMLKSEEFFDKRLRHKTPEEIAAELYRYILAREPESADALQGAADFVGNLGWKVEVDVMINSEEYLGRFGDDDLPNFIATAQEAPPATAEEALPATPQEAPPATRERGRPAERPAYPARLQQFGGPRDRNR